VIGCGTIGRLRARVASEHPSVSSVHVCDVDEAVVRGVASEVGAARRSTDFRELIDDPAVQLVIVSTGEHEHFDPAMAAIEAGKPILVEKPLVLDLAEADALVEAARAGGVPAFMGYTQRFRRRYISGKEQLENGRIGPLTSAFLKIYVTRSVAEKVLSRTTATTPAVNTLTYCLDLLLWYLDGEQPSQVFARGAEGAIYERFGVRDSAWALLEFDSGVLATVGVSWEPPEFHPAGTASMEVELFGRNGTLRIDDDHSDVLVVSSQAISAPYTPDVTASVGFLGSAMPGEWALGTLHGPMRAETAAFVEAAALGRPSRILPPLEQGRHVLAISLAIDRALTSREPVSIAGVERVGGASRP
jgi:myo-inositol 2-dehydrogenase / D-chiro-inositol 1-dehydrogenase